MKKVAILHSDEEIRANLVNLLVGLGLGFMETDYEKKAADYIREDFDFFALICSYDWHLEGTNGVEIISRAKLIRPDLIYILLSLNYIKGEEKKVNAHFIERNFDDKLGSNSPAGLEIAHLLVG